VGSMFLTLMLVPVVYTLLARFEPVRKPAKGTAEQPVGAPGSGGGVAGAMGAAPGPARPS